MKIYSILLASALTLGMTSCGDFGDLNNNPESLNAGTVPYEMLFSNAQHQALGSDWDQWRTGCIYSAQFVQQLVSINWWGDYGRYAWSDGYSGSYWDTYNSDRGAMRDVTTVYDKWKDEEGMQTDWNIARVMRVYAFSKMTDLYGDIPYSQAGRPSQYSYPEYDTQESIYKSMLQELDEAQANLGSGTAKMLTADLYFSGDASKWKKFANSLMLRLAMRLVKVDESTAKTYAAKAVSNGLLTSNDDNVKLEHSADASTGNDSCEPWAKIIAHEDREFFISDFFVNMLKNTNDPRLSLIATVAPYAGSGQYSDIQSNASGTWTANDYGDMSFDAQQGLLQGGYSDSPSSQYFIGKSPEAQVAGSIWSKFNDETWRSDYAKNFSSPNRCTYADPTTPTFILTYAQQELLLAEAVVRGYVSGDAKTHYENGVKAAFKQFTQFRNGSAAIKIVTDKYGSLEAAAEAYLAKNPYNAATALEQINTQYYINSFGDEYEVFSNWRRSGYPTLVPNCQAAKDALCATNGGSIPRRFRYPTSESQVNSTNYNAAVSRLSGGDRMDSRVWWDVAK